jgi:hypothetical protein
MPQSAANLHAASIGRHGSNFKAGSEQDAMGISMWSAGTTKGKLAASEQKFNRRGSRYQNCAGDSETNRLIRVAGSSHPIVTGSKLPDLA